MFFDEPTLGLNATDTLDVIMTLRDLARSQRTVVCTMHQPRSNIFEIFDSVMLLAEGSTVYFGPRKEMSAYFGFLGFPCPAYVNPCDHALALVEIDKETQKSEETSRAQSQFLVSAFQSRIPPFNGPLPEVDITSHNLVNNSHHNGFVLFFILLDRMLRNSLRAGTLLWRELSQVRLT